MRDRLLGTVPSIALILAAMMARPTHKEPRELITASTALTLAPLLIFTNLHINHNYYQAANQIYLLMALASSAGLIIETRPRMKQATWCLLALIITGNIKDFAGPSLYLKYAQINNSPKLEVGRLINEKTPKESGIIVYGDNWNSSFAFHSQRRALTIPQYLVMQLPSQQEILRQPERWLNGRPLGAMISNEPLSQASLTSLKQSCQRPKRQQFESWWLYLCSSSAF